jgi:hypothetical protein
MLRFLKKKIDIYYNKKKNVVLETLPKFNGVSLIDIGAAGDLQPRFKAIEKYLNYYGFEPDSRSRKKLLKKKNLCKNYTLFPYAISKNNKRVNLNLCRKPQVSSTYSPLAQFTNLFPDSRRFDVINKIKISAKKLDSFKIRNPDFIKLDIQGGELNALKGANKILKKVFGLEIEVEFRRLYKNQPLFGEISSHLCKYGFEFIDFVNLCRWDRYSHNNYGQLVFGDAFYLKTPENIILNLNENKSRIPSYLSILFLYKRFDLLKKFFELAPKDFSENYDLFKKKIKKIEKYHNTVKNFASISSKIIKIFDNDSRIWHLN